jgi:hypothetical protein
MSEATAQAEAFRDGFLQSIGESYDAVDPSEYPVAEQMFLYYGKMFNDAVAKNLKKSGSIASGKIAELALPLVNKFGNNYEMYLGYKKDNPASVYYKFVNKGVKGTKNVKADSKTPYAFKTNKKAVPVSSIEKWLGYNKLKSVSVSRYTRLGTERKGIEGKKSLAFLIARSIHRKGLKSTHYFDRAVAQIFNKEFIQNLAVALGADVQIQIKQTINGNNNNK